MKKLVFLLFAIILFGCNKPDPNPELKDPIFADLEAKKKTIESQIEAEKKNLKEAEDGVEKAVPQTGQIKFAKKHYFDVKAKLENLEQIRKYYAIRIESRKTEAQEAYLIAFEKKEPWPDPQEFEDYKVQESARTKSRNWSVKDRIAQESVSANGKSKAGGEGEGGGEGEAPKSGH